MRTMLIACALATILASGASAEMITFDQDAAGRTPEGWIAGVTGSGSARWLVATDDSAPSKPNVLRQSAVGAFPWIVLERYKALDGFVETRFRPLAGREDQAGGIVWRFQSGESYYVARANALEDNVSIYYVERGSRKTIRYVDARSFGGNVARNQWHTLRVEYRGPKHSVFLDGRKALEVEDGHITAPGTIGLWTKADSVTSFDDFAYGPNP